MATAHVFELFGGRTLHIAYFRDVKNSADLLQKILAQELDVALINADMVVSLFQVDVAASRALLSAQNHSLTTNTLHSELVFNLSGTRNVTDSLRRFGIGKDTTHLLVCAFDDASTIESVGVDGVLSDVVGIENAAHLSPDQLATLKKHYKIQDVELQVTSLVDAVVSRIATKNVNK
ncbi:Aste57867_22807 [Aphanomyces stellatus]|uniref:Aste57867_22807 protein n=1 Tax=Aphanomyces stellatus TaxID=120398 RepID=A0A485LMW7_9STRA|nr:hypothetical protein As57867_022737 [Aphanomyces stellatus]VFT99458.1 Aste57867_22807 [Aphanomyces stellatus]